MQEAWRNLLFSAAAIALYRYWEAIFSPETARGWTRFVLTVCVVLFLVTFFRFLRGDEEYLAERYSAEASSRKSISGIGRGIGLAALLVHGGVFTGLALSVTSPELFVALYSVLLAVNVVWLWLNLQWSLIKGTLQMGTLEGVWICYSRAVGASRRWCMNNAGTVVSLLALKLAQQLGWLSSLTFVWLGLTACFLNCLIDLALTWPIYFRQRSHR
jgi:hypothetical protein